MPKVAEPPKPEVPPNLVVVAGKQEHHQEAGFELAAAIGFQGEPHLQSAAGLRVEDAQNFLVKSLHESFQAGAKGEDGLSVAAVCEHLGVDDASEIALVGEALAKAHEDGKGATLSQHPVKVASFSAGLVMGEEAAKAAGKAVS